MASKDQDTSPVTFLRPDDLMLLRFHFHGLKLQQPEAAGQPWTLVKNPPNQPKPLIIVEFPPQSIGEEAYFEVTDISPPTGEPPPHDLDQTPKPPGQVGAFLSGPTWLVFNVANQTSIPYTLDGIIAACVNGNQVVSEQRKEPPKGLDSLSRLFWQGRLFSRIEAPYHLVLSPEINTTWWGRVHAKPNAAGTRIELWHAAMIKSRPTPANKRPPHGGKLRAVWAADFTEQSWPASPPNHENEPRMSLDKRDRYELVRLTTDPNKPYTKPIEAEQLILSTMGAWLKAAGAWENLSNGLSVTEWKHLMTMGRDHFVRVVYQGYLFPFGHEASLVKITERKFQPVPGAGDGQRAAYLRTRMFVIVRQPTLDYNHNGFPFTQVTLKTLVTPGIDDPVGSQIENLSQDAFWIRASGKHVQFRVAAVDHEGRTVEFTTPLAFVSNDKATLDEATGGKADVIVTKAWSVPNAPSRTCTLGGQAVAFAPHALPNDTTLETQSINLGAKAKKINSEIALRFRPIVTAAQVDIPAVKQLLGTSAPSTIEYVEEFREAPAGQFGNPAEVFARVTGAPKVAFSTEQAGGLVKPDFTIEGLSRSLGPVPKVDDMLVGKFDPKDVFPTDPINDIVLLGGIQLNQIVNLVGFDGPPPGGEYVPRLVTTVEAGVAVVRYRWYLEKYIDDTDEEYRGGLFNTGLFVPDSNAAFEIVSEVRRPLDDSPGSFLSMGRLTNFSIVLMPGEDAGLVKLHFGELKFTARSGQKTDVVVALAPDPDPASNNQAITFLGPLRFVNALMQIVPLDGFSDPPYLNIDANGVRLGYTLALPNVAIGVFSLQNLSLSAGFDLPFVNMPATVSLAFCARESPGQVLVSLFGGGVFFGITLDTKGVQLVEMALEFGAAISLNLGVASGSVTVMGGVYFQKSGTAVLFSAYIRMVGKVSVLGLISITVEFYLALEYLVDQDKLFGIAALRVKVKIAFFSKTVSLEVRREFKGSDPTFRQMLALSDWQAYCEAYGD